MRCVNARRCYTLDRVWVRQRTLELYTPLAAGTCIPTTLRGNSWAMTNGGSYLATALLLLVQLDTVRADECRDYGGVGTDVWTGGMSAGYYVPGTAFGCSGYQP